MEIFYISAEEPEQVIQCVWYFFLRRHTVVLDGSALSVHSVYLKHVALRSFYKTIES